MRKHLKTLVLLLIMVCILWRLWRRMNWSEVRQSFSQANNLLLAVSIAVSCGTNFVRACRWRTLLSPLAPTRLHEVFAATNIGIGAGFLFTGAVGEVVRPLALSSLNKKVQPAASFLTVVVERIFDVLALALLFGLTILWLPQISGGQTAGSHLEILGLILLIFATIGLCSLVLFRSRLISTSRWVDEKLVGRDHHAGKFRNTVWRYLQKILVAFSVLSNSRDLLVIILWTACQWLSVLLTNWLILRAFGLAFGFRQTLLVMCCGLIGAQVPIPGGAAGAFHAALSGALVFLGVTLGQAAAISITAHLVGFLPALAFGSYYLLRGSIKLKTLQRGIATANDQKVVS